MIVFVKEKIAFLSVPKTGTTAWQKALADRADILVTDPPELKHAPVYRYNRFFRPMFEKVCKTEMDVIAVMREPIDWLGSWYRFRRRDFNRGKPTSTHDVSFDEFVDAYARGDRPPFANVGSQFKFLESRPNGTRVTHLFRYENPEALRNFLSARLGPLPDLPRANVSPRMELNLSPATEAKLRRKFPEDFALYDSIG